MWEFLQDRCKIIPGEAGSENATSVQSCHQGYFEESKIYFDLFNTFLVTT